MLHFAVCDDEQTHLNDVCCLLREYSTQRCLELNISDFLCPGDLSKCVEKGELFHAYLLDVFMPGVTGIDLAQDLRCQGIEAPIIFLTTSEEHALEAFGVGATQYLVKPFNKNAFFSAMDAAVEIIGSERRRQIVLKVGGEHRAISVRNIIYAETFRNYEYLRLVDGETLLVRMTSGELFELLAPFSCFTRCGSAYILNLAHIRRLSPKFALMTDGNKVPVPRGKYSELKERYYAFYSER